MRVAIIGAQGQLGSELTRRLSGCDVVPLARPVVDVSDFSRTRDAISEIRPDVVINTAAFTRVDDCEDDMKTAFSVNAYAVRNLADVCAEVRSVLVHVSTDYVFGGEKRTPYAEDDAPYPLSVYGTSKLAGEYFARNICPRHFVVRTSGLYGAAGSRGKGGNFVETMIRLAQAGRPIRVVSDQVLTPTYARDVAEHIGRLMRTEAYGVYHVTNDGECSWYEFAARIFSLVGMTPDLSPTTSAEFGARATRPPYSVLAHAKLAALGFGDIRPWPRALADYLCEKRYLSAGLAAAMKTDFGRRR